MKPSAPIDPMTALSAARFGVYVHFPFCLSKCPYCDFASVVARQIPQVRYTEAIIRELRMRVSRSPELIKRSVDSLYFGGGTPSLWNPKHLQTVLSHLAQVFDLPPFAEITLEANPGAADAGNFLGFARAGINRLYIVLQSF